jgi:Cu(I)/Ag(I) efflux system membrane fusion protein
MITSRRLRERIGQRISAGDLVATVQEQRIVTAEIMVSEKEIADVAVGQPLVLRARALPSTTFSSRVGAIAPTAVADSGLAGRFVKVTGDIDNASRLLRSEMTGQAKIDVGTRRIAELLSRRLARYIRIEFWSWW